MCGIAGFWSVPAPERPSLLARRMGSTLARRGPDSAGEWHDPELGIGFGHRRLSVQDLSAAGHQPMRSASGRTVICYNGEIYNHRSVREALASAGAAIRWRGDSDTETLLEAIEHWGLEAALERCNGMFAFAVVDRAARTLSFARDRLGEKPLYVARHGCSVLFGSELQALRAHPDFRAEIDEGALALFVAHATVPAPHAIYRDVVKLLPGHLMTVRDPLAALPPQRPYWSLREVAEAGARTPLEDDEEAVADRVENALREAVSSRLIADVPLGAFLSGGIDSSLVVALMRSVSSGPVRTFTIGFDERDHDESDEARAVAAALGTEHTELRVDPARALALLPELPAAYTEPFADPSQVPTCLVAELTREFVTVSLSGDGGDELFGGYRRYIDAARVWSRLAALPTPSRRTLAGLTRGAAPPLARMLSPLGGIPAVHALEHRLVRWSHLARLAASEDIASLYGTMTSGWAGERVLAGAAPLRAARLDCPEALSQLGCMMLHDALGYLPETIMTKVDRASMRVSLEARAPLLDHRLVELAWRLPDGMRVRDGRGKWILRTVLHRYLEPSLVERPKRGFGVPLGSWLRGPLRDWAEALLEERRLREEGFFDPGTVRRVWREHLSGAWDRHRDLWPLLVFQAWLDGFHRAAAGGEDRIDVSAA